MSELNRLTNNNREKTLRQAISRIEYGRAQTKATKISIASVAREAGISAALIHNHHPKIAELIREKQGFSSRAQRDAKHAELRSEREKNRELRSQMEAMRTQMAKLASINEVLTMENQRLKAILGSANVSRIESGKKA